MSKYLCCGTSKKTNIESENEEYQLLLLGPEQSGKFNIIEQIATLQDQFTQQERINRIRIIKGHIQDAITDILQNYLSAPTSLEYPTNQSRIDNVLTMTQENDFNYPREFFDNVNLLWSDATIRSYLISAIQYEKSISAKHFLDRVNQIKLQNYIPNDQDMIHSRRYMSQICEMSFEILNLHFRLIEIDLLQPLRRKWIHCFSNVNCILFIANCSSLSAIEQSLNQFCAVVNKYNYDLNDKPVLLLLHNYIELTNEIEMNTQNERLTLFIQNLSVFDKSIQLDPFQCYTFAQLKSIIKNTFIMKYNESNRSDHPLYDCETSDGNMNIVKIISDVWPRIIRQNGALGYRT